MAETDNWKLKYQALRALYDQQSKNLQELQKLQESSEGRAEDLRVTCRERAKTIVRLRNELEQYKHLELERKAAMVVEERKQNKAHDLSTIKEAYKKLFPAQREFIEDDRPQWEREYLGKWVDPDKLREAIGGVPVRYEVPRGVEAGESAVAKAPAAKPRRVWYAQGDEDGDV